MLLMAGFVNYAQVEKPLPDDGDMTVPQPEEPHNEDKIYDAVEVAAQYPGGYAEFRKQLAANVDISKFQMAEGSTLKLLVKFVVERDGSISTIQVIRDPGYGAGKEVERALKSLKTKWTPAIQNGKPVRSYFSIPLVIVVPAEATPAPKEQKVALVENVTGDNDLVMTSSPYERENEENAIYALASLEVRPEFPGGITAFKAYITKNFKKENLVAGAEGKELKVYIGFTVEKDGSMTDIKILRDPGFALAKEAERILKSIKTKWTPGMQNGKPVRTGYIDYVIFNVPK